MPQERKRKHEENENLAPTSKSRKSVRTPKTVQNCDENNAGETSRSKSGESSKSFNNQETKSTKGKTVETTSKNKSGECSKSGASMKLAANNNAGLKKSGDCGEPSKKTSGIAPSKNSNLMEEMLKAVNKIGESSKNNRYGEQSSKGDRKKEVMMTDKNQGETASVAQDQELARKRNRDEASKENKGVRKPVKIHVNPDHYPFKSENSYNMERDENNNAVNFFRHRDIGKVSFSLVNKLRLYTVIKEITQYSGVQMTMNARITSICFHHKSLNMAAVGTKSGYVVVGKLDSRKIFEPVQDFLEIGKGNAMYALKFAPNKDDELYGACWDGTVTLRSIQTGLISNIIVRTHENQWFTSLDISNDGDFLVSGCTMGKLHMYSIRENIPVLQKSIHPQRVLSVQVCPRDKNVLVTTSLDKMVKLWDIRYLKDKSSYMTVLPHRCPPATATFNYNCSQLMTSDQNKEIRVYSTSSWRLNNIIEHPHRQFMHISPIKASWHPYSNIILIGRYPDKTLESYVENEPRTIDFFCSDTGKPLYNLMRREISDKIASINVFNGSGTILASGKGNDLVFWSKSYGSN